MPVTDIISLPAEKPGSSYLLIIIRDQIYSEAFPDLSSLRSHFRKNPTARRGASLPPTVRQTNVVELFGDNKTHSVIAVLGEKGDSMYHLVGGPSGHMWDMLFIERKKAADFAQIRAAQYDLA